MASKDVGSTTAAGRVREKERQWLGAAVEEFPWVHLGLGLLGNAMFFVGSIFFFYEGLKTLGIWLFVIGSFGMLVASVGEFLIRIEKKRHEDR